MAPGLTFAACDWAGVLGLRAVLVLVFTALVGLFRHPVWCDLDGMVSVGDRVVCGVC